ncbi:hypothetical protein EYM_06885 [Ignicoccus islandicus DSM 13165]|uniref:Uncharacterized protein n=1 Tax=Ignicoccus islandicus DSM 13165 TaxID=940295 RepID=A0A0U2MBP3_9CREN|nr:DUF58 domain-containing protein [Ignicoccus islandicus]ALU12733.1 hypothetical protein EYM_06885 [Ignicoccus islandicus DSM 13165]
MREYLIPAQCSLNEDGRKVALYSSIGLASAILFFPWLGPVLAASSILTAASIQAVNCNKKKKIKVRRSVERFGDTLLVKVIGPKQSEIVEVSSVQPLKGSLKSSSGILEYQIDLKTQPFVYWNGILVKVERGKCECSGYLPLNEFYAVWKIEELGLAKVIEVEGGYQAIPEIEGAREYRPGDEPRLVIWKTLNPMGTVKVKELKRVREEVVKNPNLKTFSVELGPWKINECFRSFAESVAEFLRDTGMKEVKENADLLVIGPNASIKRAANYFLLNPLACIPNVRDLFPAIEIIERKVEIELRNFMSRLSSMGSVRVIPWLEPPRYRLY